MDDQYSSDLQATLDLIKREPRGLSATFAGLTDLYGRPTTIDDEELIAHLQAAPPSDPLKMSFIRTLSSLDYASDPSWGEGTAQSSRARRELVYRLMAAAEPLCVALDSSIPVANSREPVVVALEHRPWYDTTRAAQSFYWPAYEDYLVAKGWNRDNIAGLDRSSTRVVERLADPTWSDAYPTRGLVVGYVQSGKTANFTGVAAKAVDAGYRLVIVMSGTLNLLRGQTQRRIDMELVGMEVLKPDLAHIEAEDDDPLTGEYDTDPDWQAGKFISYGARPSELGWVDFDRLTNYLRDFEGLKQGIGALRFEYPLKDKALNDPLNLAVMPARLLVVKKNASVLQKLVKDLRKIPEISQVPTLIIDDEADQASINTTKPDPDDVKKRTKVNKRIVQLLSLLPRAQYVGYTATPFANVFIDPNDPADLFPRDFVISLDRPTGYVGVSDFHDLTPLPDGTARTVANSNEKAFVRPVYSAGAAAERDLQRALDVFVLTGAIKLFRETAGTDGSFRHHTMLVHESSLQDDHKDLKLQLERIWEDAGYTTGAASARLERRLNSDLRPVWEARGSGLPFPKRFKDLAGFVGETVRRINEDGRPILIVNGDKDNREDTPDFDLRPIWRVIVGGTKLSRGYTVEGLTVSYYRRRAASGSTLMQMGRWFGYRPGYQDLVRLFIGRQEPVGNSGRFVDLYEAFEAVCRDEESFREQLLRYVSESEGGQGLRPMDLPPLVANHAQWLPPVGRNFMFNAVIKSANFGGDWIERTVVTDDPTEMRNNLQRFEALVSGHLVERRVSCRDADGAEFSYDALHAVVTHDEFMMKVLKPYVWGEGLGKHPLTLEKEFLEGAHIDPEVDEWTILCPIVRRSGLEPIPLAGVDFPVVARSRVETGRFKAFSTSRDRAVATSLVKGPYRPDGFLATDFRETRRGSVLVYAVQPRREAIVGPPTLGLVILPPRNSSPKARHFGVRLQSDSDSPVVPRAQVATSD
jgi:hypothetical protein